MVLFQADLLIAVSGCMQSRPAAAKRLWTIYLQAAFSAPCYYKNVFCYISAPSCRDAQCRVYALTRIHCIVCWICCSSPAEYTCMAAMRIYLQAAFSAPYKQT